MPLPHHSPGVTGIRAGGTQGGQIWDPQCCPLLGKANETGSGLLFVQCPGQELGAMREGNRCGGIGIRGEECEGCEQGIGMGLKLVAGNWGEGGDSGG